MHWGLIRVAARIPDDLSSRGSTSLSAQATLVPTQAEASLILPKGCTGQASPEGLLFLTLLVFNSLFHPDPVIPDLKITLHAETPSK